MNEYICGYEYEHVHLCVIIYVSVNMSVHEPLCYCVSVICEHVHMHQCIVCAGMRVHIRGMQVCVNACICVHKCM